MVPPKGLERVAEKRLQLQVGGRSWGDFGPLQEESGSYYKWDNTKIGCTTDLVSWNPSTETQFAFYETELTADIIIKDFLI